MDRTFDEKVELYADLILKVGLGLRPGQRLMIRAPIETAPTVRIIGERAYKAGARYVDYTWNDDALTLIRFQNAPRDSFDEFPSWQAQALNESAERGDAVLSIHAAAPDLLRDQEPDLIALAERTRQTAFLPFSRKVGANELNWSVASLPIGSWAARIFPHAMSGERVDRLWNAIFRACRINEADPFAAWEEHNADLDRRCRYMNSKQYVALRYRGPGTALTVGMPERHLWAGGRSRTPGGIYFNPNIPTEEIFSAPHKDHVNGTVASSMPLSYGGTLITDITLAFEAGRVVRANARTGEAALQRVIDTDEGSSRLGEVALVPNSSPISQSGILFYSTLFDENAACHLAFGRAYRNCVEGGAAMSDSEFGAAGGNYSLMHVDFMVGSPALDIDGIRADGAAEPVIHAGEWAF
jgi:aminopeptidase